MYRIAQSRKKSIAGVAFLLYVAVEVGFTPTVYSYPSFDASAAKTAAANVQQEELTFIDEETSSFAVFNPGNLSQLPTTIGKVRWFNGRREFVSTRKIQGLEDAYVMTDPRDPDLLQMVERLPSGGFGRLLRYRGWTADEKWVDLEFVYQDKENGLIILDYNSGKFFRTILTQERQVPRAIFPRQDGVGLIKDVTVFQPSSPKLLLAGQEAMGWRLPDSLWLRSQFEGLSQKEIWSKRLVRGPPAEGRIR